MPLDPQARMLLDSMAGAPPLHTVPIELLRQGEAASVAMLGAPEPVAKVENREIDGPAGPVPVRIYTPEGHGPFPILIIMHGGGWILGNLDTFDVYNRAVTNRAGCISISVDYRLAPENKFPVPLEDCYAVLQWAAEHGAQLGGDSKRLAILGDSAGGNLAAGLALLARDRGGPKIIFQVLVNPALEYPDPGTPSMQELGDGKYGISRESLRYGLDIYLQGEADRQNPYFAPPRSDNLAGLPPALVLTAEYDPLRDEGEIYAEKLREAGVSVQAKRYDGVLHGWVVMAVMMDKGKQALIDIGAALRAVFE
ncbi:MAG TPA: alpha/beta hydrolase [Chloroflexia bacterium]|nr:alpha/beta hydrolase [Chloroflexia bacterium]